jgi:hypothetical protein
MKPRPNKYHARKTTMDGIEFASAAEARRYGLLRTLEIVGEISDLKIQPVFPFEVNGKPLKMRNGHQARYKADFSYTDKKSGERIIEECKGFVVRDFPLRRALFEHLYGCKLKIVK